MSVSYVYRVLEPFASVGAEGVKQYIPGDKLVRSTPAKESRFLQLVDSAPEPELIVNPEAPKPKKARGA